jgi:hypothetical protein
MTDDQPLSFQPTLIFNLLDLSFNPESILKSIFDFFVNLWQSLIPILISYLIKSLKNNLDDLLYLSPKPL